MAKRKKKTDKKFDKFDPKTIYGNTTVCKWKFGMNKIPEIQKRALYEDMEKQIPPSLYNKVCCCIKPPSEQPFMSMLFGESVSVGIGWFYNPIQSQSIEHAIETSYPLHIYNGYYLLEKMI